MASAGASPASPSTRPASEGLAVLPFCPFVNEWMKRHPEYVDLVPAAYRANFEL